MYGEQTPFTPGSQSKSCGLKMYVLGALASFSNVETRGALCARESFAESTHEWHSPKMSTDSSSVNGSLPEAVGQQSFPEAKMFGVSARKSSETVRDRANCIMG